MTRNDFLQRLIASALLLSVPKGKRKEDGFVFKEGTWFHILILFDKRPFSSMFKNKCRVKVYVNGKHVATTYQPDSKRFGSLYANFNSSSDVGTLSTHIKLERSMNLADLMDFGSLSKEALTAQKPIDKFCIDQLATWDRQLSSKEVHEVSNNSDNLSEVSSSDSLTGWWKFSEEELHNDIGSSAFEGVDDILSI